MINPPTTLTEARAYPYGMNGYDHYWDEDCSYEIYQQIIDGNSTYVNKRQCSRANGHGIAGLYCRQHAGIVERILRERKE